MPCGASIAFIKASSCNLLNPRPLIEIASELEFNIRITTLSPRLVGNIEIRKSTSGPFFAL